MGAGRQGKDSRSVELMHDPKKRRRFSRHFKQMLVTRMEAGENVSALAREVGVQRPQLYRWRNAFRTNANRALADDRSSAVPLSMRAVSQDRSQQVPDPVEPRRLSPAVQDTSQRTVDQVRLDLRRINPGESLEAARAFYSGILSVDVLDRHTVPVLNHGSSWRLGDGVVATEGTTSAGVRLSPDRNWLSNTCGEFLIVRIHQTGRPIVFEGDDIREMSSGCIYMSDRFDALWLEAGKSRSLVVRADRLGRDRIEPSCKSISTASPFGRVLHAALSALFVVLPTSSPAEVRELGTLATSLLRVALDGRIESEGQHRSLTAARDRALQAFTVEHAISETRVTAEMLSTMFGVSRATVYRAFEEVGGIQRFVAKVRLRRSFGQLAVAAACRGSVGGIASACGYMDVAHFSRSFKREFGCTPSDIVGLRKAESRDLTLLQAQEHASWLTPMIRLYT
ncbi:MAG: helix-turn-helix domain-containing protein [Pseudomonadota bacterium]